MKLLKIQSNILLLLAMLSLIAASVQAQNPRPLIMQGKETLFQRVIAIPGTVLREKAGHASKSIADVSPFTVFYVYERQELESGTWLQVGYDSDGSVDGWVDAGSAIDWNQALTVSFKDPAKVARVPLFGSRDALRALVDKQDRSTYEALREKAAAGDPSDSPVIAIQPPEFIDIRRNFYLVPILEHEDVLIGSEQGRLLHVASVPLQDPKAAQSYRAGVVFVIDTTVSMGPYIERTRETMQGVYQAIEASGLSDKVSFGLVGYRDNNTAAPGLEYLSKVFVDLQQGVSGETFLDSIANVRPAPVSSQGFNEDAYAGVKQAIEEMDWEGYDARYVILISDAGPRSGSDALSATRLSTRAMRDLARESNIATWVLHLRTPEGAENHPYAEEQYRSLTQIEGIGDFYYGVETGDVDNFQEALSALTAQLTDQVAQTARGLPPKLFDSPEVAEDDAGEGTELEAFQQKAERLGYALRMQYLNENKAAGIPVLFDAWLIDRDFANPEQRDLDVRVILTRDQLSDLHDVLRQVLTIAEEGALAPQDFLGELKSLAAAISRDPEKANSATQVGGGQSLADLGYMREYIEGLPYTSEVMNLDLATWQDWSAQKQFEFINQLDKKIAYYKALHENVDLWISLDGGAVDGDSLYPLLLEALP
ncbi:MAG TPA: vWA domain-containing protein [Xanthomonadales bacterium]|nr:vWA domain-containing protein [Xanthomonadales bacterium]